MDPVVETRNASLLLIFGAVSPCMPYCLQYMDRIGSSETHKDVLGKTTTCLLEDESAHLSVPLAPGPNDENVTVGF